MAPAEIWQGGRKVNKVKGDNTHQGKMDGEKVWVKDDPPGCQLTTVKEKMGVYIGYESSITLDDGIIVKSVRR